MMGAPSLPGFQLDRTFFGLDAKDRPKLHDALFNLLWAGDGRWDWPTLYNMPIWLRNFWIRKINKMHTDKSDAQAAAQRNTHKKNSKAEKVIKPPM